MLAPGEMLYIPSGALHAAETLDHSMMLASNDGTFQSMYELAEVCAQVFRVDEDDNSDLIRCVVPDPSDPRQHAPHPYPIVAHKHMSQKTACNQQNHVESMFERSEVLAVSTERSCI